LNRREEKDGKQEKDNAYEDCRTGVDVFHGVFIKEVDAPLRYTHIYYSRFIML
jgi:ribosomal protein L20